MASGAPRLLVVGNPLLDLIVLHGEPLVEKYKLKSNDAILAGPEHATMCVILETVLQPKLTPFRIVMQK